MTLKPNILIIHNIKMIPKPNKDKKINSLTSLSRTCNLSMMMRIKILL